MSDSQNQEPSPQTPAQPEPSLASQQEVDSRVATLAKAAEADPELQAMRERMAPMPRSLREAQFRRAGKVE